MKSRWKKRNVLGQTTSVRKRNKCVKITNDKISLSFLDNKKDFNK